MKNILKGTILTLAMMLLFALNVSAQEIKVNLNGNYIQFDQPPIIQDGRTLVPFRAIFEHLGAEVEWNNETRTAIGYTDDIRIELPIDKKTARVNGKNVELDVPAMIVNGRTLVPLRFISETMGLDVDWDNDTRTVIMGNSAGINLDEVIVFNDEILEFIIRIQTDKSEGNVYVRDVQNITWFGAESSNITNIDVLANFTNLESLIIYDNNISDISALSNLTNLKELHINVNNISDISALAKLTNLEILTLTQNNISDISPLANLTSLEELYLEENSITDFSVLDKLPNIDRAMFE